MIQLAALTLVLSVSAGSAWAQTMSEIGACRDIQDSLLRLRCFDDVSKPRQPVTQPVKVAAPDFGKYPAEPHRGKIGLPDFRGRDRSSAMYRTRITEGAKGGPNFAGHLALVEIGCGSGCRFVPVIDVRDGRVLRFPLGGDENPSLDLKYRVNSRLVAARWTVEGRCKHQNLVWTGSAFQQGPVMDLGEDEACYRLSRDDQ